MRGEDFLSGVLPPFLIETPPRAWGRLKVCMAAEPWSGNTPTCVGKTLQVAEAFGKEQKHPHVRGEDIP